MLELPGQDLTAVPEIGPLPNLVALDVSGQGARSSCSQCDGDCSLGWPALTGKALTVKCETLSLAGSVADLMQLNMPRLEKLAAAENVPAFPASFWRQ